MRQVYSVGIAVTGAVVGKPSSSSRMVLSLHPYKLSFYVFCFFFVVVGCRSVCLPVYLSVCLHVCLSVCRSICLSVGLSVCLSVCPSVCQSVCMSVCMSVCLPVCLSVGRSVSLFVCLSVCLSASLSLCLSACLMTIGRFSQSRNGYIPWKLEWGEVKGSVLRSAKGGTWSTKLRT